MTRSISVQLYSVRNDLADLDATFARLSSCGATAIEPFSAYDRPAQVAAIASAHGLGIPSVHAPLLSDAMSFGGNVVPVPPATAAFAAARALGAGLVIDPMVAADRWSTGADVARTADRMNAIVDHAEAEGLRLGYHNHSFEFHNLIDGRTAYEHFVSLLDERVCLELDVYWAAAAGQDVPGLIDRLGPRIGALHLKDASSAVDVFADGATYDSALLGQLAVGSGSLQILSALVAAPDYCLPVIEFDHVDGDVFDAIASSVAHLRAGVPRV